MLGVEAKFSNSYYSVILLASLGTTYIPDPYFLQDSAHIFIIYLSQYPIFAQAGHWSALSMEPNQEQVLSLVYEFFKKLSTASALWRTFDEIITQ